MTEEDPIKLALSLGADEDLIARSRNMTHLELRQYCSANNIDLNYSIVSDSLREEINQVIDFEGWSVRRVASRYNLSLTCVQAIIYDKPVGPREPEVDKDTLKLYVEMRCTKRELSEHFSLSTYRVNKLLELYSLKVAPRIDEEEVITLLEKYNAEQVANLMNISYATVYRIKKKHVGVKPYKKTTKTTVEQIRALHHKGYTQSEIAKELGVSQATVSRKLCRNS